MLPSWPPKDPDELLDYEIDWSNRLAGDTIISSIWVVPVTITENAASNTSLTTTIWLDGGTVGDTNIITNRINTLGGRIMDQSVSLKIVTK